MAAVGLALLAQNPETYKTRLSAVAADGKSRADLAGIGSATAALAGTRLTISGTFEGLKTPATAARLHNGIATGARGPAIRDLTVTRATSGALSATLDLTAQEVDSLRKGKLYIQLHSEKPPDGTLWGWLLK
jgi:hypothetical protein